MEREIKLEIEELEERIAPALPAIVFAITGSACTGPDISDCGSPGGFGADVAANAAGGEVGGDAMGAAGPFPQGP